MNEENTLLPCPFCGGTDALVEQLDSDASVVICESAIGEHCACLARGPVGVQQDDGEIQPGKDAAIEAWNRRAFAEHDPATAKPEPGRYVLAWMQGRATPIRAMWVPSKWLEADDECPEDWAEYDEDKDEYFCPEGWYERNEHEEKHWSVGAPVVAWMDLPRRDAATAAKGA